MSVGRPAKYSISDKQEAFGLYINGMGHREISEKLNERYDWGISMRTIQKWSEKMGWPEQLKQVELDLAEEVKKTVVRDMGARMAEVEEVRQEFLGRLRKGGAEIRGHEFAKLTDMLNSMSDLQGEKDESMEAAAMEVEEVLDGERTEKRMVDSRNMYGHKERA